jgi:ABC-type glutathione transport system ATPase component
MQGQRQGLPAYGLRESIVQTIGEHQVVVIEGETGSGKTTQVTISFLLKQSNRMMQGADFWFCGDWSRGAVSILECVCTMWFVAC